MDADTRELMIKLHMSLDTCMDLVKAEAAREKRREAGKSMRSITWQERAKSFQKLLAKVEQHLAAAEAE